MKIMAKRILLSVLWTACLGIGIFAFDRIFLGARETVGWIQTSKFGEIPPKAQFFGVPPYLPRFLGWPPQRIFYRTLPSAGWWIELGFSADSQKRGPALWIGTAPESPPAELGDLIPCLREEASCPKGWHSLSVLTAGGQKIEVLTRLEAMESARLIEGLRRIQPAQK